MSFIVAPSDQGFSGALGLDWRIGGEGTALTVLHPCGLMLP